MGAYSEEILKDYETCARERVAIFSRQWFKIAGLSVDHERLLLPFDDCDGGRVRRVIAGLFYRVTPALPSKAAISKWVEEERHLIQPVQI